MLTPLICTHLSIICGYSGHIGSFLNKSQSVIVFGQTTMLSVAISSLIFGGLVWVLRNPLAWLRNSPLTFFILALIATPIFYEGSSSIYAGFAAQYTLVLVLAWAHKGKFADVVPAACIAIVAVLAIFAALPYILGEPAAPEFASRFVIVVLALLLFSITQQRPVFFGSLFVGIMLVLLFLDYVGVPQVEPILDLLNELVAMILEILGI